MRELEGSLAVVTGASRGIGRAITLELARGGASLLVAYRRASEASVALHEELAAIGASAVEVEADLSTVAGTEAVLLAAEAAGGADIVVNNAGIADDSLAIQMSDEQWDRVLALNASGTFRMCRGALQQMFRKRSGTIVNVVSISGLRGNPGQANYSASKAAVVGLTRTLAREMGRRGIRVNAVAPGLIRTDMLEGLREEALKEATRMIPMRRLGAPEDVAPLVRFLVGPGAAYISGQVVAIDGAMSC